MDSMAPSYKEIPADLQYALTVRPENQNINWLERGSVCCPSGFGHIVNLAGVLQLPRQLQLGVNFSFSSAPPISA
jgi:hypothetical protein